MPTLHFRGFPLRPFSPFLCALCVNASMVNHGEA
jgi:hypothetical protein